MIGPIVLLVIGLVVITYGALSDRRRHRRAVTELLSPPPRAIPQLPPDTPTPRYISSLQARQEPADIRPQPTDQERSAIDRALHGSTSVAVRAGLASDAFMTDRSARRCVLRAPRVLVTTEPVMTIRELITVLEHMITDATPLVIITPSIAPDVLDTLEVNHIQRRIDLAVVISRDPLVIDAVVDATGAAPVGRIDLQTAAVSDHDLGRCAWWVADRRHGWIVPGDGREAGGQTSVTPAGTQDQA